MAGSRCSSALNAENRRGRFPRVFDCWCGEGDPVDPFFSGGGASCPTGAPRKDDER